MNDMEAKELMIGDWVCCINGDRHYPKAPKGRMNISGYGSGNPCKIRRLEHVAIVEFDGEYISEYGSLQPIPLTPEILEKNGFVAEFASEDYRYDDKMILTQSYDKKGYWWVVGNMYVCQLHYVHELQHALRLCGLNELADNFKLN